MRMFDFKERKIIKSKEASMIIFSADFNKMLDMKLNELNDYLKNMVDYMKSELNKHDLTPETPVLFYLQDKNISEKDLGALRFTFVNAIVKDIILTDKKRDEEELMGIGLFPDLQYATIPYTTLMDLVNRELNYYVFDIVFSLQDQEVGLEGDVAVWQF